MRFDSLLLQPQRSDTATMMPLEYRAFRNVFFRVIAKGWAEERFMMFPDATERDATQPRRTDSGPHFFHTVAIIADSTHLANCKNRSFITIESLAIEARGLLTSLVGDLPFLCPDRFQPSQAMRHASSFARLHAG